MVPELKGYLESIRRRLRLDPPSEAEIVRELYTHIEDRVQELQEAGLSEAEAARLATEHFGRPEALAREIYEAHSKGSWRVALLAAMPNLFLALFFALRLWHNPSWIAALLISIAAISAYGWWHGRPSWFYSWLSYSLVPVLVATMFSLYALGQALFYLVAGRGAEPNPWIMLAILAYTPLTMWLLVSVATKTVRRDWLYGSLMALPLLTLAWWLMAFQLRGSFFHYNEQYLIDAAPWIALSFLAVALGVATFVRLGRRHHKAIALLGGGLLAFFIVAQANSGAVSFLWLGIAASLSLVFLFSPALLERKRGMGSGNGRH